MIGQQEAVVTVDDGAGLWTVSTGPADGPPLVLCHGGPGLWDYLGPVAALVDTTYRIHRYDQRGCGRSTGPHDYRLTRAVADLDRLRQHWGYDRWAVFGHSWGATLALAYAWTHPERVDALIYCGGVGPDHQWQAAYRAEVARRLTVRQRARRDELRRLARSWDEEVEFRTLCWLPDYADPARAAAWARAAASVRFEINWRANRELGADQPDVIGLALRATAPTLLLHGERDPRPSSNSLRLLELLPNATAVVIPHGGHLPWVEAPREVSTHLNRFLSECRSGSR